MIFHREGATTEKAHFHGPTKCTSLTDGTCSISCLPILLSQVDIMGERQSFKWMHRKQQVTRQFWKIFFLFPSQFCPTGTSLIFFWKFPAQLYSESSFSFASGQRLMVHIRRDKAKSCSLLPIYFYVDRFLLMFSLFLHF